MLIFLNIFIILCIFVMGSLFGSFFSLAMYRIPRREDIIATRSYCPKCKHKLQFFDLIPVISYIMRGGKCKYCDDKISMRYFLLEITNGLAFVAFYCIFGYTLNMLYICIIYILIFLLIGTYIMSKKMSVEEKKQISKIQKEKRNKQIKNKQKTSKKSGVFLSELIIAILMFIILTVSAFVMSRNSIKKTTQNILEANANTVAVKNIEMCLATKYDKLVSYTLNDKKDDVTYTVKTNITKLSDQDRDKKDLVKQIEVNVAYMQDGVEKSVNYKTLKGKVE